MKTLILTILITSFFFLPSRFNPVTAQGDTTEAPSDFSRTSFFLELGGNALSYSLNVDHFVSRQISLRAGISVNPSFFSTIVVAPIMVNYLAGQNNHFLELGIGVLLGSAVTSTETGGGGLLPAMTIGYRWQPTYGGFLFRAGFTPIIIPSEVNFFEPRGGISVGYTFR